MIGYCVCAFVFFWLGFFACYLAMRTVEVVEWENEDASDSLRGEELSGQEADVGGFGRPDA